MRDMNTDKRIHCPCASCKHDLGGGYCRINLEGECREGGGYEAWEEAEQKEEPHTNAAETALKWSSIVLCAIAYPLVIYRIYEWIKSVFF